MYQHLYIQYWGTWPIPLDLTAPGAYSREATVAKWPSQTLESPNTLRMLCEETRDDGRPEPLTDPEKVVVSGDPADCPSRHREDEQPKISEDENALVDQHPPIEDVALSSPDDHLRSSFEQSSPESSNNLLETFEFFQPSIFIPRNFKPEQYLLQPLWYDSSAEYEVPNMSLSQLASSDEENEFHPMSKIDRKVQRAKRNTWREDFELTNGFPYDDPRAPHGLLPHLGPYGSSRPPPGQRTMQNTDLCPRTSCGYLNHQSNIAIALPSADIRNPPELTSEDVSMNTALGSPNARHAQDSRERSNQSQQPTERWLNGRRAQLPISGKTHDPHASFHKFADSPLMSHNSAEGYGSTHHSRQASPHQEPALLGLEPGETHISGNQTAQGMPPCVPENGARSHHEQSLLGLESRASLTERLISKPVYPSCLSHPTRQSQSLANMVNFWPEDPLANPNAYIFEPHSRHAWEFMRGMPAPGSSEASSEPPDRHLTRNYEQIRPHEAAYGQTCGHRHSEAPATGIYQHGRQHPMPMNQLHSVPGRRIQRPGDGGLSQRLLDTASPTPHDPWILRSSNDHLEHQDVQQSNRRQAVVKGHFDIDGGQHKFTRVHRIPEMGARPWYASSRHQGKPFFSKGKPRKNGWSSPKKGPLSFNWNSSYHHEPISSHQRMIAGANYTGTPRTNDKYQLAPNAAQSYDNSNMAYAERELSENSAKLGRSNYDDGLSSPERMVINQAKERSPYLANKESTLPTSQEESHPQNEMSTILQVGDKYLKSIRDDFGSSEITASKDSMHIHGDLAFTKSDPKTEDAATMQQLQVAEEKSASLTKGLVCPARIEDAVLAYEHVAIQTIVEANQTLDAATQTAVEVSQRKDVATQTDGDTHPANNIAKRADVETSEERITRQDPLEEDIGHYPLLFASEVTESKPSEVKTHSTQANDTRLAIFSGIPKSARETDDSTSSGDAYSIDVTPCQQNYTGDHTANTLSSAMSVADTCASKAAKATEHNVSTSPSKGHHHASSMPVAKADNVSTRGFALETVSWTESPSRPRPCPGSAFRAMIPRSASYGRAHASARSIIPQVDDVEMPIADPMSPVSLLPSSVLRAATKVTGIDQIYFDHKHHVGTTDSAKMAADEKDPSRRSESGEPSVKDVATTSPKDTEEAKSYEEMKQKKAELASKNFERVIVDTTAQQEPPEPSDTVEPIITRKKKQKKTKFKNAARTEQSAIATAAPCESQDAEVPDKEKTPQGDEEVKGKAVDEDWKARYLLQRCMYQ